MDYDDLRDGEYYVDDWNELIHLKDLTIKGFNENIHFMFLSSLLQKCKALVSLNIEGKFFRFFTYSYICMYNFSL